MNYNGVFVQIPARSGSKRVPRKNLRYLGDKPLIGYAIDAIKQTNIADPDGNVIEVDQSSELA